jgi:hypothetical protein
LINEKSTTTKNYKNVINNKNNNNKTLVGLNLTENHFIFNHLFTFNGTFEMDENNVFFLYIYIFIYFDLFFNI